jgi:uncharacterized protein
MCETCEQSVTGPGTPSRRTVLRGAAGGLLGGLGAAGAGAMFSTPPSWAGSRAPYRLLVFSRTTGFRHASIEKGVATVTALGQPSRFDVEATEDHRVFTRRNLRGFDAVLFLNTTGNVLAPPGRKALRRFVLDGGGWAGVHSAADTEYDWPFYTRLLAGARFLCHPAQQPGVIVREDARHRSTRHLEERWQIMFEEFYSFTSNPRDRARVLLTIDESTYLQDPNTSHLPPLGGYGIPGLPSESNPVSGRMGDHPMSWTHRVGGGRSWYTALGHEESMYDDKDYRRHLLGGLLSVLRHGRRHRRR